MRPLSGIRVLDFSRLIPGNFATLMLAELGADVIKVEDAKHGDPTRHLPPSLDGQGLYHLLLNRGKKSVAVDFRRGGWQSLLEGADVVVESFRPSTAKSIGVAAEQLRATRPELIHCAITGYGQTGPNAEKPGHDLNYVAEGGLLAVDRPGIVNLPRMFIADVGGGAMSAVAGILAALFARERTGDGASLDISMHDAVLYWMMLPAARELVHGAAAAGGELPTFGRHATYNVYDTADGQRVALGALEPKFWHRFCDVVGRPDWKARQASDEADQAALVADVRTLFLTRSRGEWLQLFSSQSACLSAVNSPSEALADPHVAARDLLIETQGLRAFRAPFISRPAELAPAPALGQHNRDFEIPR
ncbi:MAG: CoA transferase [Acidobacteria bacterium]|nr:MAG: CoA transferase [Acidobacteriota bacterium]